MDWSSRVRKSVAIPAGLMLAAGLSASVASAQGSSGAKPSMSTPTQADVQAAHCARRALPLPGNGVARAAQQALDEAAARYPGTDVRRAKVQWAARSAFADARGRQVRRMCGPTTARRTVVVQLYFPRMRPSASLSQGVVFVARFPRGYRVWHVAH